jgi:uncharacterized membrane protein YdjX (TVP38/TMEM64 family)
VSGAPFLSGWRLTAARILALAAVIAITIFIFLIRDRAEQLQAYGYPGVFLISLLANATVILPAPGLAITFAMGAVFHPVGVALAAGAGATLGELTGYLAGFSGQAVVQNTPAYERVKGWMRDNDAWTLAALAFLPNPLFDLAGGVAGALRIRLTRFLFWVGIGKILKMLVFAYAGAYSIDWLARWFG